MYLSRVEFRGFAVRGSLVFLDLDLEFSVSVFLPLFLSLVDLLLTTMPIVVEGVYLCREI